jgi:hypothetical protein
MLQLASGQRFIFEALDLFVVYNGGKRQHLERDAATHRNLLCLVDDTHTAAADLTHDAKVAQCAPGGMLASLGIGCLARPTRDGVAQVGHRLERGQKLAKLLGAMRMLPN